MRDGETVWNYHLKTTYFENIIESESEKWFILPFLYLISVVIKITDYWWIYYVNQQVSRFLQALLLTYMNCVYQFVRKGQSVANTAFEILYTDAKNPVTG